MRRIVSVGAEVVRRSIPWCQGGGLAANDATARIRALGVEVIVGNRWVKTIVTLRQGWVDLGEAKVRAG